MQFIGEVSEIFRYPVKSFQGEHISTAEIGPYGMLGDRQHILLDQSKGNKHLSAKQRPFLLGYSAAYSHEDPSQGTLQIKSLDGKIYNWDEQLQQEIAQISKLPLSLGTLPIHHEGLMAVDAEPILLAFEQSLKKLEEIYGGTLQMQRFRPNFVITSNSAEPFEEFSWLGRTVRIGDVELEITQGCKRCMMVNVDPKTINIDLSLLKKIVETQDGSFGVYAQVKKMGKVTKQDKVYLLEE